jgi:hypothetical protein
VDPRIGDGAKPILAVELLRLIAAADELALGVGDRRVRTGHLLVALADSPGRFGWPAFARVFGEGAAPSLEEALLGDEGVARPTGPPEEESRPRLIARSRRTPIRFREDYFDLPFTPEDVLGAVVAGHPSDGNSVLIAYAAAGRLVARTFEPREGRSEIRIDLAAQTPRRALAGRLGTYLLSDKALHRLGASFEGPVRSMDFPRGAFSDRLFEAPRRGLLFVGSRFGRRVVAVSVKDWSVVGEVECRGLDAVIDGERLLLCSFENRLAIVVDGDLGVRGAPFPIEERLLLPFACGEEVFAARPASTTQTTCLGAPLGPLVVLDAGRGLAVRAEGPAFPGPRYDSHGALTAGAIGVRAIVGCDGNRRLILLTTATTWGAVALADPLTLAIVARTPFQASWIEATTVGASAVGGLLHEPDRPALGLISWKQGPRRKQDSRSG